MITLPVPKFRIYLRDKYRVDKAFLFIGYVPKYKKLYTKLKSFGYELIYKPTVRDNQGSFKGNVDAELVLYAAAVEYTNYDKAIIVSGDGDFYCLIDYLKKHKKLGRILIPNPKSESSLLKKFHQDKTFICFDKKKLELKPLKNGRRRS